MKHFFYILFTILMVGCNTANHYDFDRHISLNELSKQYIVSANQFDIMYLSNNRKGRTLHVYLDGDGLPWLNRFSISPDPTPRNPLALSLMTQDPFNAIYLARPCYFAKRIDPKCNPRLWTSARYSETVVASLLSAINQIVVKQSVDNILLIGYSGGGTLAALLSERLSLVTSYVTIAANLDTKRWTEHHQFSPLTGSINPMDLSSNNYKPGIHFVGGSDQVVPIETSEAYINKTAGTRVIIQPFNHRCCWVERWPLLLEQIHRIQSKLNQPDVMVN